MEGQAEQGHVEKSTGAVQNPVWRNPFENVAFHIDRRTTNWQVFMLRQPPICCDERLDGADPVKRTSGLSICPDFRFVGTRRQRAENRRPAGSRLRGNWRTRKPQISILTVTSWDFQQRLVSPLLILMAAFQGETQSDPLRRFSYGRYGGGRPHLWNYRNRQFAMVGRSGHLASSVARTSLPASSTNRALRKFGDLHESTRFRERSAGLRPWPPW